MEAWEGKIKGYDQSGAYVGTYEATVQKDGDLFYKMTIHFDCACKKQKTAMYHSLPTTLMYSSSLEVLKRRFKKAILLKVNSKIVWKKKILHI